MMLVDTSVWIHHLRSGDDGLATLLDHSEVVMHPLVLGELACGNLRQRKVVLSLLKNLPQATVARDEEVLFYIERHELMGSGAGYVDVHLMAAVALDGGAGMWTRDKRLQTLAAEQGFAYASAWTRSKTGSAADPSLADAVAALGA